MILSATIDVMRMKFKPICDQPVVVGGDSA